MLIHFSDAGLFRAADFRVMPIANAVHFFFVLSGFVLAINADKYKTWPDFMVARIGRVWPAHLASLVLSALLVGGMATPLNPAASVAVLALNILLLQAWVPERSVYFSYNAPSWSLSCEMFFYALLLPLIAILKVRPLQRFAGVVVGITALLWFANRAFSAFNGGDSAWVLYVNPIAGLPMFCVGVGAGVLFRRWRAGAVSYRQATLLQLTALALNVVSGLLAARYTSAFLGTFSLAWVGVMFYSAAIYAALIFACARFDGLLSRGLGAPLLVFLGDISYAVYLFHLPLMTWLLAPGGLLAGQPAVWQFIAIWAAIIAVSAACYLLVEQPARRWVVRAWTNRRAKSVPDALAATSEP